MHGSLTSFCIITNFLYLKGRLGIPAKPKMTRKSKILSVSVKSVLFRHFLALKIIFVSRLCSILRKSLHFCSFLPICQKISHLHLTFSFSPKFLQASIFGSPKFHITFQNYYLNILVQSKF